MSGKLCIPTLDYRISHFRRGPSSLYRRASVEIRAGRVKTTWKYPTGSRSASRSASHVRAAFT